MPANTKESTTAGPALSAATVPVRTKMPVPMMAPMPSRVRLSGPSTRFRLWSPAAWACSTATDFRLKRFIRPRWLAGGGCGSLFARGFPLALQHAVVPAVAEVDGEADHQPDQQPEPGRPRGGPQAAQPG